MKPLYPTLKEKKRYILIKLISDYNFRFSTIEKELKEKFRDFLGETETAKAGIIFFNETWEPKSKTFILRVGIKQVDRIKGAITLIKSIKNKPMILSSLKTSGKLNKLKDFQKVK